MSDPSATHPPPPAQQASEPPQFIDCSHNRPSNTVGPASPLVKVAIGWKLNPVNQDARTCHAMAMQHTVVRNRPEEEEDRFTLAACTVK